MKRRTQNTLLRPDVFEYFHGINRTQEEIVAIEREVGGRFVYDTFFEFNEAGHDERLWAKHGGDYLAECRRRGIKPMTTSAPTGIQQ
jgi:hypothetical protein